MEALVTLNRRGFAQTERKDTWWLMPLVTFVVFTSFIVYSTWAAFQNAHYAFGGYLSPMYSPEIFGSSPHAWFGPKPGWWPALLPFSPECQHPIGPFAVGFVSSMQRLPPRMGARLADAAWGCVIRARLPG